MERDFSCPKGALETAKSVLVERGPSEGKSMCAKFLHFEKTSPKEEIIGTEILDAFVGCAEFVNAVRPESEEDRTGDWIAAQLREKDFTATGRDDEPVKVSKE